MLHWKECEFGPHTDLGVLPLPVVTHMIHPLLALLSLVVKW